MWAIIGWVCLGVLLGGAGVVGFFWWLFKDFDGSPWIRF